ncbi:MAG: hypothetical protein RLY71_262 [Pseudomonadota bacterium]|jgi:serine/threonine-protein kinase
MLRPPRHFWKQDWGAVLLALLISTVAWIATDHFARLERQWYDLMVAATPIAPSPDLVVVGIDDTSVAELGPWPWSRDLHARLIDTLSLAGARLVVLDVPTAGAEGEQALAQLQRISGAVTDDPELAAHPRLPGLLLQAQEVLDADAHLAASLAHSQHVLLAVTPTHPPGATEPVVPWPLAALGAAALGVGHDEWQPEADGRVRTLAPTLNVSGRHIPSLALWVLAQQQATSIGTLQVRPIRRELTLGATRLPLDHQGLLRPPLIDPLRAGIVHHSARDVLTGRISAKALAGKIVLIGPTSAALVPQLRLPDDSRAAPVSVLALATAAVLSGQLIAQPVWVDTLAWLLLGGVALHLVMLAPRLARVSSLAVSSLFGTALLVSAHVALTQTQTWLPLMLPLLALLGGHAALLAWQLGRQRWGTRQQAPITDLPSELSVMDDPFESALDQPQPPSAEPLTPSRRPRTAAANEPIAAAPPPPRTSPEPTTSTPRWPRLGQYQLDRELGHGAMGRVYLAHQLETSRVVVVKTLSLAQEFDGEALREARRRFLREAEAASRLKHPGIVRIHSSGEERGLAYLVMDWLRGHNLTQHIQSGTLLPLPEVLEIVARVAEALAHAHTQGVIHRDIKPSNVMIDPVRGDVTVTDFGIARIIDGRSTRTGMMLGSPLYMSPEQLMGRSVDGRSDLYSLGVLLFELLTGELPSRGDSIAELIKSVTSQKAPDVRTLRPNVPQAVAEVVALTLEKQPELRYRNGIDLATDLRLVAAALPESPGPGDIPVTHTPASVEDVAPAARTRWQEPDNGGVIVHNRSG